MLVQRRQKRGHVTVDEIRAPLAKPELTVALYAKEPDDLSRRLYDVDKLILESEAEAR